MVKFLNKYENKTWNDQFKIAIVLFLGKQFQFAIRAKVPHIVTFTARRKSDIIIIFAPEVERFQKTWKMLYKVRSMYLDSKKQ